MNGHYICETGRKVYFADIGRAIDTLHPRLRGKHIFQQLEVLNLYGEFRRAHTGCALPYSFTDCVMEDETCLTS